MKVINYLHKIQGIDKSLPLLAVLRKYKPSIEIVTIIDLEDTSVNAIPPDLLELLKTLSDVYLEIDSGQVERRFSGLIGQFVRFIKNQFFFKKHIGILASEGIHFDSEPLILLCINSCQNRWLGRSLIKGTRRSNGKIIAYLKSVHDRNRGLTVNPESRVSKKKGFYDVLLLPNQDMYDLFISSGYLKTEIFLSGYTPFYRDWFETIENSERVQTLRNGNNPKIVVFSRGPVQQKRDDEQVLTKDIEKKLLEDIVEVTKQLVPDAELWFKPHPYQKTDSIIKICKEHKNCSIKWESVHTLSAAADIAISMYSSSCLDALVFNKPSIEYFIESPGFRKGHPKGSPFGDFGVTICRDKDEFRKALHDSINGNFKLTDVKKEFGHVEPIDDMIQIFKL